MLLRSLSRQLVEEQGMLARKPVLNGIENITLRVEELLFDTITDQMPHDIYRSSTRTVTSRGGYRYLSPCSYASIN